MIYQLDQDGGAGFDKAWKFVQWLSDPKTQVQWFQTVRDLPAVPGAWSDPALTSGKRVAVFRQFRVLRPKHL